MLLLLLCWNRGWRGIPLLLPTPSPHIQTFSGQVLSLAPVCSLFDPPSSRPHHLAECPSFLLPLPPSRHLQLVPFDPAPCSAASRVSLGCSQNQHIPLPKPQLPTACPLAPLPSDPTFGPKWPFSLLPTILSKPGPLEFHSSPEEAGKSRVG